MSTEINYSDGDIESEILAALKAAPDVSSSAIIAPEMQEKSWPFEYHLARERVNLVRHIDFKDKRVLEIGAGMGSISRYIAERCSFLQVVEGTSRRLACLQERLRDLNNYNVYCGNFDSFEADEKFDIVSIVGVLEYAEIYYSVSEGQNPFVEFLKKAKSFLKDDGIILVAIENRIGMKYWAGATEDHTGGYFDGILGYPSSKSVRTFSRKEMLDIFSKAGISKVETHYPFPDYKMPRSILTDQMEVLSEDLFSSIASATLARDYSQERAVLFSDSMAFESLKGTGLLREMANSFLFIAGDGVRKHFRDFENILGYSYSQKRKFNCRTEFRNLNHEIWVSKESVDSKLSSMNYGSVRWVKPEDAKVTDGDSLISMLRKHLTFREWNEFEKEMSRFLNWIDSHYSVDKNFYKASAWDLIPQNVIFNGREFIPIDQEWEAITDFSKDWFLLRCILSFDRNMHEILKGKYHSLERFYEFCCTCLNISYEHTNLVKSCKLEIEAQRFVGGWNSQPCVEGDSQWSNIVLYLQEQGQSSHAEFRGAAGEILGAGATSYNSLKTYYLVTLPLVEKMESELKKVAHIRQSIAFKLYFRIRHRIAKIYHFIFR